MLAHVLIWQKAEAPTVSNEDRTPSLRCFECQQPLERKITRKDDDGNEIHTE
jgi:hypothetical protein